jgi:mannitol/fructose-specific phosphotransferase system IIA component (Ntr-type)
MRVRDFLEPSAIRLPLLARTRDEALAELVGALGLADRAGATVIRQLQRRETLGSTGFGGGIAIPHCRTLAVGRLRVGFGLSREGITWGAADGHPVHSIFLIVAPPSELSNQYLQVLGRVAQFLHEPGVASRLHGLASEADLLALLDERSA